MDGWVRKVVAAGATGSALLAAGGALAEDRLVELISTGPAAIRTLHEPSRTIAVSESAGAIAFLTTDKLVASDKDERQDVYLRTGGQTRHVSIADKGGNGPTDADAPTVSRDGSRAFFHTTEALSSDDVDSGRDVYVHFAGATTLASPAAAAANEGVSLLALAAPDGSRFLVGTREKLLPDADADTFFDIYERTGGAWKLRTPGTAADVRYAGAARDLSRVIFQTAEKVTPATDQDTGDDVYEHTDAGVRHLSVGRTNEAVYLGPVTVNAVSLDGTRVIVSTEESLAGADADAVSDLYELGGASPQLITVGTSGGNAAIAAAYYSSSDDATVVAFDTTEVLEPADKDAHRDLYVSRGGKLELASATATSGQGQVHVGSAGGGGRMSADGRGVIFNTAEALTADDKDAVTDVYEYFDGALRLVSQGELGSTLALDNGTGIYPETGHGVFFGGPEAFLREDVDRQIDTYVRAGATTRLVTPGREQFDSSFVGWSADGGRFLFLSREQLSAEDTDDALDLYATSFPTPQSAPDTRGPAVTVHMNRKRFRISNTRARIVASQKRRRTPVGTGLAVYADEDARVNMTFYRRLSGRRTAAGRCVQPTRRLRRAARCTRERKVARGLSFQVKAGRTIVRFFGRLDGKRRLSYGRYRMYARGYDAVGNPGPLSVVDFRTVRR